ncbi:MAG: TRAP transporter large permease [Rhodospirillales bacterium]|jgi:tripartite ATP-independent transporter DctM subunit|nr:TRAP transporter large permease [Rhodospirillales bacterium]MDP6646445.1 TRAP transporter large permease [Rhodospirillales bacterium]|tara:strand:- start:1715 stop:3016 length:1302 start_codon:yes stop_codon:yes gene_type:complete
MTVSLIGFAILFVIAFLGFPLGFSMLAVGGIGFGILRGWGPALEMVVQQMMDVVLNTNFAVLPMFLLMGAFVFRAALSDDLYEAADAWLGHHRGGLAMATIAACGGFAAVSGSSLATVATMAKVAIPSMRKYRYADSLAAGTVAAGGTLGILIPPSAALIIYGILTEEGIAELFAAGIIPGVISVVLYIAVIMIVTHFRPEMGPRGVRSGWIERFHKLYRVWGIVVLFFLILGGISFGVFTPNEAGGIGAIGALLFAILRRRMTWVILFESLVEAAQTTAMVFMIAIGALILNNFVALAGMSSGIIGWIEGLQFTPMIVLLIILGFYVLLGTVIEGLAMIFLTVPIFVPVIEGLGFDLIWFGIVLVMVVEISLITPPIGLNVFVMKSMMPEVPLNVIFRGIAPFFCADIVRLLLVVFIPGLALWLPKLVYGHF